ncbi:F-box only protein 21-like [Anoplolepis gracilipes]|uniref:F-box only protein 21-like n=1 Tax=Anoplolepis gracilipes TaxID=354296 RepID=UPI003BA245C6
MATIMCLSEEVIDMILGCNNISIEDIINFRCVCKKFRHVAKYKKFQEKKFLQRWPTARKHYNNKVFKKNEQKGSEGNEQKNENVLNLINIGINCARGLRKSMHKIIERYYSVHTVINNYLEYDFIFPFYEDDVVWDYRNKKVKAPFYIDEIKNLLTEFSRKPAYNLTEKYYNVQLFNYLRKDMLKMELCIFLDQPDRVLLLERLATIKAQEFQPQKDVFYSSVTALLDNIVFEVLNSLREKDPEHSIFSASAENFSYWKNNNIDDNQWNEAEGIQIMDTLDEYIFGKLNFRPDKSKNIEWNMQLKRKCIDYVLEHKCGQEVIIYIIYHSVGRRLGLRCDILMNYSHESTYLFWKPSYATNSLENAKCFRINSNKYPDCFIKEQNFTSFEVITANEIENILSNLIQLNENLWESSKLNGWDFYHCAWTTSYKQEELNAWSGISRSIPAHCIHVLLMENCEIPNARSKEVKFAVGMIVTHSDQSTDCSAGVIIGWHRYEDRHFVTIKKQDRRNFDILPLNICCDFKEQTHYLILTENNEMCYVGEDAITLTTPKWIENSEIGRHFDKFTGTHYVPNKALEKHYPHDAAVTATKAISDNDANF